MKRAPSTPENHWRFQPTARHVKNSSRAIISADVFKRFWKKKLPTSLPLGQEVLSSPRFLLPTRYDFEHGYCTPRFLYRHDLDAKSNFQNRASDGLFKPQFVIMCVFPLVRAKWVDVSMTYYYWLYYYLYNDISLAIHPAELNIFSAKTSPYL